MTDRRQGIPVAGIAGAVFCVVLIYLALQIRAGSDPAIGAGQQTAAEAPRQVIVRRIIVTRVVEEDDAPATDGATPAASTPAASAQPPAAAPAAPAAAAPDPVLSRGS